MKRIYVKPFIEDIELTEKRVFLAGASEPAILDPGNTMGKENNMWEESSDPIFESNKKNLWDE